MMTRPLLSPGSADALLFDLGRVVLDIDFGKVMSSWAGHAACEPAQLAARFSSRDEIYRRHETGEVGDAEFFAYLRAALGIGISDAEFLEGWNAIFAGEMPGIAPMLARAAKRLPLYAFSNTNAPHVAHFSKPMPTCSVTSAKYSSRRQSGFGNRKRRPMITWCGRSACRLRVSCSLTISPRISRARKRAD
jgi:hypothetical protein